MIQLEIDPFSPCGHGSGCWGLFSSILTRFQQGKAGGRAFNGAVLAYTGFLCGSVAAVAAGAYMGKGTVWAAAMALPVGQVMQHKHKEKRPCAGRCGR